MTYIDAEQKVENIPSTLNITLRMQPNTNDDNISLDNDNPLTPSESSPASSRSSSPASEKDDIEARLDDVMNFFNAISAKSRSFAHNTKIDIKNFTAKANEEIKVCRQNLADGLSKTKHEIRSAYDSFCDFFISAKNKAEKIDEKASNNINNSPSN
ncbi:MAG: hypothetical protein A3F18_05100 [Legionellales bacterium RIFCSPHIGHO2_12_FULL_37_14]|nr:MAG: hypothetical protein A3F18_05100 [Legionellales bacterium RIFCSPHIGHO2_12_FULL_37_14]